MSVKLVLDPAARDYNPGERGDGGEVVTAYA
jgi:hypothetical protein